LDGRMIGARFPAEDRNFSLRHHVRTGSVATQPPIQCAPRALLGGKAAGASSWPLTSI